MAPPVNVRSKKVDSLILETPGAAPSGPDTDADLLTAVEVDDER